MKMNLLKFSVYVIHEANPCFFFPSGYVPEDGVEDMCVLTNIDEQGININLKSRYAQDQIYVSAFFFSGVEQFLSKDIDRHCS